MTLPFNNVLLQWGWVALPDGTIQNIQLPTSYTTYFIISHGQQYRYGQHPYFNGWGVDFTGTNNDCQDKGKFIVENHSNGTNRLNFITVGW